MAWLPKKLKWRVVVDKDNPATPTYVTEAIRDNIPVEPHSSMAAPQIPNLLSMRGGARSRGAGRGRGRGGSSMLPPDATAGTGTQQDTIIQQTDNDASVSRLSAVNAGYLIDNYAHSFVLGETARRLPIINRGTYVRTFTIDKLVQTFLASNRNQPAQIISLGAGTDTRYWRMRERNTAQQIIYHEIDFPAVSKNKLAAIRYSPMLSPRGSWFYSLHHPREELKPEENRWGFYTNAPHNTDGYFFHPIDLRKMPPYISDLRTGDTPTLLISECCLCYLSPEEAQSVIRTFTNVIANLGIIMYEPTNPDSEFGKVMVENLAVRGLSMPTIQKYPTLQSQLDRLRDGGFIHATNGAEVSWIWNNWVSQREKQRLSELEMLDEIEEWELLAQHYLITWGWRELGSQGHFVGWRVDCPGQMPYPPPPFSVPVNAIAGSSQTPQA